MIGLDIVNTNEQTIENKKTFANNAKTLTQKDIEQGWEIVTNENADAMALISGNFGKRRAHLTDFEKLNTFLTLQK